MKNYILCISPQIILNTKKRTKKYMTMEIPSSDFRQALKVAEPHQLMAIPTLPLLFIGSQIAIQGSPWPWSYGRWIYNYLWNQSFHHWSCEFESLSWQGAFDTTLCDKVSQWLVTGLWITLGTPVSSTNKTYHHIVIKWAIFQHFVPLVRFQTDFCDLGF